MGVGVSGVEEEHVNQELEFGVTQWCEKGSRDLKIHRTDTGAGGCVECGNYWENFFGGSQV